MTADRYIDDVLKHLPRATPMRAQIAVELRGHIAERTAGGQPIDDVLRQLGDPEALAISYLSAVPLERAPHGRRLLAKAVDVIFFVVIAALPVIVMFQTAPGDWARIALALAVILGGLAFGIYTVVCEFAFGQTLGKWLAGLHVVRESGAPIGFGQALVRQLPMFLQLYWIDVLFALFTDRRQRAFELLSKTRVVAIERPAIPQLVIA
jgi:uncharacterized RDD family membrane protein YckC